MDSKNYKILVTGGFGNIGLPLVDALLDLKHTVYVIDNLSNEASLGRFDKMNFRAKVTYTNLEFSNYLWPDVKFDYVIHLASYNKLELVDTEYDKAVTDNIIGTLRLVEKCIKSDSLLVYLYWPQTEYNLLSILHEESVKLLNYYSDTNSLRANIINTTNLSTTESVINKIITELI